MIYQKGDLLSVESGIIAHGCNCQGVMGSGVAKLIKDKYPSAYRIYKYQEQTSGLKLSAVQLVMVDDSLYVANLMTHQFYGRDGKRYVSYDAIDEYLDNLLARSGKMQVNIPRIGAGLGGGEWEVISEIIHAQEINHQKEVIVWYNE